MFFRNDNKDKSLDRQIFNVSTVETLGTAKDKDFYKNFFSAANITNWIGLTGQALSGVTEFIFFFLACGGKYPVFQQANAIPIITGLFMVFVFEYLGIRVYLVRIVRQAVNKDFNAPQKIALFILNIIFCGSILFANFYTSITGQNVTFKGAKIEIDNSDTLAKIESELLIEIDTIKARTGRENKALTKQANEDKNEVKSTYESSSKDLKASKWVEGANLSKLNNQIVSTNDEKLTKLEAITDTLNARTAANIALMKEAIKTAKAKAKIKKDAIGKKESSTLDIYATFEKYSLVFLIIFMSLGILAIIYKEIFISGSKQDVELKEVKKRPILILALLYGLYMKFYHACYWFVVKIVGSKAYDYSIIMQSKHDYLSTNVSTNNMLTNAIDYFKSSPPKPQGIGFKMQNSESAKPSAFQQVSSNLEAETDAKLKVLSKYNLSTVSSWYKRSDLVKNSESKTEKGKQNNRTKYDAAKAELSQFGVRFFEKDNHVTIKV